MHWFSACFLGFVGLCIGRDPPACQASQARLLSSGTDSAPQKPLPASALPWCLGAWVLEHQHTPPPQHFQMASPNQNGNNGSNGGMDRPGSLLKGERQNCTKITPPSLLGPLSGIREMFFRASNPEKYLMFSPCMPVYVYHAMEWDSFTFSDFHWRQLNVTQHDAFSFPPLPVFLGCGKTTPPFFAGKPQLKGGGEQPHPPNLYGGNVFYVQYWFVDEGGQRHRQGEGHHHGGDAQW